MTPAPIRVLQLLLAVTIVFGTAVVAAGLMGVL